MKIELELFDFRDSIFDGRKISFISKVIKRETNIRQISEFFIICDGVIIRVFHKYYNALIDYRRRFIKD